MNDSRGMAQTLYEQTGSGVERLPHDRIVLVVGGTDTPRPPDQLREEMVLHEVNSVAEFCRQVRWKAESTFTDLDGEEVSVSLPIRDEHSFDMTSLVEAEPRLFEHFVCAELADQCVSKNAPALTAEEMALLEEVIEELERSLEGETT